MRRLRGVGWVALVGAVVLWAPSGAEAQTLTAQQADSARRAVADSVRARILQRLQRLGRAPGADSLLFVQDSLAREEGLEGRGRASGPDATVSALLSMRGYAVTEYEGGKADFGAARRVLVLRSEEGSRARVNREGMSIEADSSITYDEASGLVRTVGPSTVTPATGDPVESGGLVYDLERGRGSAVGARTSYNQGSAKWLVRGDMPLAAADSSYMSHAIFTSCELEEPHYHFETDQIKIIGSRVLVARPVRMYFADVPVMWLPFIAQSLSSGRQSGLLTPRFSVNDIVRNSTGYKRRLSNIGFYWAMSDYSDAILALDWFSDNFLALTSSVSYRFNRHFLDGNINFRQYWRRDGGTETAVDTRHSWEYDERTQFRVSGRWTTSTAFVRDNSFNPQEVTQSIDSEGGGNRRFDWGTLSLTANRRQYMSDDRIEWTLPSANLSLSSITLFRAPDNRARFWNNMTVGGSASFRRSTVDKLQADTFNASKLDTENQNASVRTTFSMGNFSLSQSVDLTQDTKLGIPEAYLALGDSAAGHTVITGADARSITEQNLRWQLSLNYQQQLIGSTTLTPSLSFSGNSYQSDTDSLASSFVGAPSRITLGASLKTDIYGFFPGFGGYERIRHKFSPSFSYDWSPETQPTALQELVFKAKALQSRNAMSVTLNQTFEAKRALSDSARAAADSAAAAPTSGSEPRRVEQGQIVQLLGLRTSVVQYDFVEADERGFFLAGFETIRLSNTISSDFLSGLSLSVDHDLFEDVLDEKGVLADRRFDMHLAQVNMGFSLGSNSGIFRLLGLAGRDGAEPVTQPGDEEEDEPVDPFTAGTEASIIPGVESSRARAPVRDRSQRDRGWQANLSYSLQRPRNAGAGAVSQSLNGTLTLSPTANWDLSWRTSYDLEAGAFNDHAIRLTRDLHRWEAHFDFNQTATGNWQFRFEVSLTDNRDLKFDYQQRNLDAGRRGEFF
ncbi:MAG: hypothetical protein AMXMBFR53_17200 [Gemmatimonadota bacterium]